MIDTNVLVYAHRAVARDASTDGDGAGIRVPTGTDEERARDQMSLEILTALSSIAVSPVSTLEFCRTMRNMDLGWYSTIAPRFHTVAITGPVAIKAAELLHKRNVSESVCPRCLSSRNEHECKKCERMLSSHQRISDAMIAACAECDSAVGHLLTYDTGIVAFGAYMKQCKVYDLNALKLADLGFLMSAPKPSKRRGKLLRREEGQYPLIPQELKR
ncbi:hypothetical protein [Sorangium sp. So ce204]|uniref:hypothetical protein n=1 Tax=Sorangium sp. So ce204 TaxID=3133288 RepID=UPI003F634D69